MLNLARTAVAAVAVSVMVWLSASPGEARIVCRNGFQLSGGNWISTPYCNDDHLAQIARKHGVRVSGAEIRANPSRKNEVCRFIGGSPSAREYCPYYGGRGRGW